MIENRFVFIIPFRNVKPFIKECYDTILAQKYNNWIAIFCDDASTDGTVLEIPKDDRFIVRINENRITAFYHSIYLPQKFNTDMRNNTFSYQEKNK